jgi:hypothetical protein
MESGKSAPSPDDVHTVLEQRLKDLAANVSAITEGGGKPDELVDDIVRVAEALIAYNEAYGTRPGGEMIRRALKNPRSRRR